MREKEVAEALARKISNYPSRLKIYEKKKNQERRRGDLEREKEQYVIPGSTLTFNREVRRNARGRRQEALQMPSGVRLTLRGIKILPREKYKKKET